MLFDDIVGQEDLKQKLIRQVKENQIPHAQLFIDKNGYGGLPLAYAYAQYIICKNVSEKDVGMCNNFMHPDIIFTFPTAINKAVKSKPNSNLFLTSWQMFMKNTIYGDLNAWYRQIEIENKQGQIYVEDAINIVKRVNLKPFESMYKVAIIWMAEKLNISTSNKLLKVIEEPPPNTIFMLITSSVDQVLPTIVSRCQQVTLKPLKKREIEIALKTRGILGNKAKESSESARGSFQKALELINQLDFQLDFEKWFIRWIRAAFKARNNKKSILDLIEISEEISKTGREVQKEFLSYVLFVFRQALLLNYQSRELVYINFFDKSFQFENFSAYVNENNILDIVKELEDAEYNVSRNAYSKLIFIDLSIKLTRLLHKKNHP